MTQELLKYEHQHAAPEQRGHAVSEVPTRDGSSKMRASICSASTMWSAKSEM
jgi:hypothetical protein